MPSQLGDVLPVALLHGLVGHQFQERTGLIKVINLLLQVIECLPLPQPLWQLSAPAQQQNECLIYLSTFSQVYVVTCMYIPHMHGYLYVCATKTSHQLVQVFECESVCACVCEFV